MTEDPSYLDMTKRPLDDAEYAAIGRIVRACAELEDCVNLWITKLAGAGEPVATVFLGRSNVSTKIAIAEGLASLKGGETLALHKAHFGQNVNNLLSCRNAVAHGAFVGVTPSGSLTFLTNTTVGYGDDHSLDRKCFGYKPATLNAIAEAGLGIVGTLDDALGIGALRKKRRSKPLPAPQVDQQKGKRGAKPKRPPQASPK
jgi:hypothetical protein